MQVPLELRKKYIQRRMEELHLLRESLDYNDFGPALRLGHQVKGNAATFEFPHIGSIGQQMEIAARNQNKEELTFLADQMSLELSRARLLLQ